MRSDLEQTYRDLRPYAFAIAYRMLGSVSEAEDIVQEMFLRMGQDDEAEIRSPKAYVATVTSRLAIDHLRSARARREAYFGPWLPEPVVDGSAGGLLGLVRRAGRLNAEPSIRTAEPATPTSPKGSG